MKGHKETSESDGLWFWYHRYIHVYKLITLYTVLCILGIKNTIIELKNKRNEVLHSWQEYKKRENYQLDTNKINLEDF